MVKELRTAAALEVRWAWSHGTVCPLGAQGHCWSEWHWLRLPVVVLSSMAAVGAWQLLCLAGCLFEGLGCGSSWCLVLYGCRTQVAGLSGTSLNGSARAGAVCPAGSTCRHLAASLSVALCLQASVYLVRSGKGNARRVKAHSVHAPARRLARTTISLGPDEGIAFGLRAVRSVNVLAFLAILLRAKAFENLLIEVYPMSQAKVVKLHLCAGMCCSRAACFICLTLSSLHRECNAAKSCDHGDSRLQKHTSCQSLLYLSGPPAPLRWQQVGCSHVVGRGSLSLSCAPSAGPLRQQRTAAATWWAWPTGGPTASSCAGCCGRCATGEAWATRAETMRRPPGTSLAGSCR